MRSNSKVIPSTHSVIMRKVISNKYEKTITELAREAGLTFSNLQKILDKGASTSHFNSIMRLCETLDINPQEYSKLTHLLKKSELLVNKSYWITHLTGSTYLLVNSISEQEHFEKLHKLREESNKVLDALSRRFEQTVVDAKIYKEILNNEFH